MDDTLGFLGGAALPFILQYLMGRKGDPSATGEPQGRQSGLGQISAMMMKSGAPTYGNEDPDNIGALMAGKGPAFLAGLKKAFAGSAPRAMPAQAQMSSYNPNWYRG